MQTVGQIIRERRMALGLTLQAVARAVGSTRSYLSMIENHRVSNPPSRQLLCALEQALDIADGELLRAADWQITPEPVRHRLEQFAIAAREGESLAMRLKHVATARKDGGRNLDELYRSGQLTRWINSTLEQTQRAADIDIQPPVRYRVPLINRVAAGYPKDFTDLQYPARMADEFVACPDMTDPDAFAARVVGESMLPEYREGDIVVFSPAAAVRDGADCFVRLEPDHEATFKRVFFEHDLIRLQPLNAQFPPRVVHRELVAGLYRAVWRIQSL